MDDAKQARSFVQVRAVCVAKNSPLRSATPHVVSYKRDDGDFQFRFDAERSLAAAGSRTVEEGWTELPDGVSRWERWRPAGESRRFGNTPAGRRRSQGRLPH